MFGLFRKKTLQDVLNQTKRVKVHGVFFVIRKINVLNYIDGSKILQQSWDTYKNAPGTMPQQSEKKIMEYMSSVIVAGTVEPKISFKQEEGSILVDHLFTDWDLAVELHNEILAFTYGKKKGQSNTLQKIS